MSTPATVAETVITIAAAHLDNGAAHASSARLCYQEARERAAEGNHVSAADWALRSLAHSVGILHRDHARASAMVATLAAHAGARLPRGTVRVRW